MNAKVSPALNQKISVRPPSSMASPYLLLYMGRYRGGFKPDDEFSRFMFYAENLTIMFLGVQTRQLGYGCSCSTLPSSKTSECARTLAAPPPSLCLSINAPDYVTQPKTSGNFGLIRSAPPFRVPWKMKSQAGKLKGPGKMKQLVAKLKMLNGTKGSR